MPSRARVAGAAWRVPPSAGGACGPSACSTSPSTGGSPPAARCCATSAPLGSGGDCAPPVRSADSFEVPSAPGVSSEGAAGRPSVLLGSWLMLCLPGPWARPLRGRLSRSCCASWRLRRGPCGERLSRSCLHLARGVRGAESVLPLVPLALGCVLDRGRHQLGPVPALGQLLGPLRAERLVHDLRVDLQDRVHQHLRA